MIWKLDIMWISGISPVHACRHTHPHIHTHLHTLSYSHTRIYKHTTYTHTHTRTHMYTHAQASTSSSWGCWRLRALELKPIVLITFQPQVPTKQETLYLQKAGQSTHCCFPEPSTCATWLRRIWGEWGKNFLFVFTYWILLLFPTHIHRPSWMQRPVLSLSCQNDFMFVLHLESLIFLDIVSEDADCLCP